MFYQWDLPHHFYKSLSLGKMKTEDRPFGLPLVELVLPAKLVFSHLKLARV